MMHFTRREFLIGTLSSLAFSGWSPPSLGNERTGNIIVILLEGGMDGLAAVPPIGDNDLFRQRESLVTKSPLYINDFFGLHPSLHSFSELMDQGQAAIVHATNIPYTKRSHFEGQNVMETGNLKPFSDKTGWLGRALDEAGLSGKALSLNLPLLMRGNKEIDTFFPANLKFSSNPDPRISKLLSQTRAGLLSDSFTKLSAKYSNSISMHSRDPKSLAIHAGTEINKLDGPKAAVLRVKRFDTHANQGAEIGQHFKQLELLNSLFKSLKVSLGNAWSKTIIVTLTEFGRTVRANGSEGTDHGYASAGFLAGGLLSGTKMLSDWPGLKNSDLYEERDLMATIDYRSVLSGCIESAFGLSHDLIANKVFYEPNLPRISKSIFRLL